MMEIKKAVLPKDIKLLNALDGKCFPNLDDLIYGETWKKYQNFILYFNGRAIGYASWQLDTGLYSYRTDRHEKRRGSLHLTVIGVLPAYRKRGVGEALLAFALAYARLNNFKSANATSRKSNKPIISLVKKFGFKITKEIKDFYPDGETAVVEERFFNKNV